MKESLLEFQAFLAHLDHHPFQDHLWVLGHPASNWGTWQWLLIKSSVKTCKESNTYDPHGGSWKVATNYCSMLASSLAVAQMLAVPILTIGINNSHLCKQFILQTTHPSIMRVAKIMAKKYPELSPSLLNSKCIYLLLDDTFTTNYVNVKFDTLFDVSWTFFLYLRTPGMVKILSQSH